MDIFRIQFQIFEDEVVIFLHYSSIYNVQSVKLSCIVYAVGF